MCAPYVIDAVKQRMLSRRSFVHGGMAAAVAAAALPQYAAQAAETGGVSGASELRSILGTFCSTPGTF